MWQLVSFEVSSGTQVKPRARLILKKKTRVFTGESSGDGPVDACFKAIDKITSLKAKLEDFRLEAVTSGKDALGHASLKLKNRDTTAIGRGSSTDIVEAAIRAYLDALNKLKTR